MPIRFPCTQCAALLSIATRKGGAEIACPECGHSQRVPADSTEDPVQTDASDGANWDEMVDGFLQPSHEEADNPTNSPPWRTPSPQPDPIVPPPLPTRPVPSTPEPLADATGAETEAPETVAKEEAPAASAAAKATEVVPPSRPTQTPPTLPVTGRKKKAKEEAKKEQTPDVPEQTPDPRRFVPGGMILCPRWTLYVHALLYLVFAAGAFGFGYYIGRGDASLELQAPPPEVVQRILVEGLISYAPAPGERIGDEQAVVIVVPVEGRPKHLIPIGGLRPHEPAPTPADDNISQLLDIGGAYGRADAEGRFSVVLPKPGTYNMLIISRNANRAAGRSLDEIDQEQIHEYLERPADLIGRRKYAWTREEFVSNVEPIELDFGAKEEAPMEMFNLLP